MPAHVRGAAAPGDDAGAEHGAGARADHQVAVAVDALAEDVLGHHRQQRLQRERQERHQEAEDGELEQRRPVLHVGQAGAHLVGNRAADVRHRAIEAEQQQRRDHDEERQAVEQEADRQARRGQRHAGDQRAEDARQVELEGIERDGVGEILARHQGRQQRLVGRAAEGLGDAGAERQRQHRVDRHVRGAAEHERGEHEGAGRLHELRADEQPAPVVPIRDHAADQRQQQDRQLADEGVEAEPERRSADRQDQPVLRDLLHPRPRRGQHVAAPEQPEVAGGERRGEAREAAPRRRRRRRRVAAVVGDASPRSAPVSYCVLAAASAAGGGCRMLAQWLQDRSRSSSTATIATSTPPP